MNNLPSGVKLRTYIILQREGQRTAHTLSGDGQRTFSTFSITVHRKSFKKRSLIFLVFGSGSRVAKILVSSNVSVSARTR